MAQELSNRMNMRLKKTKLQEAIMKAFSQIHKEIDVGNFEFLNQLLQEVIQSLPPNLSEFFDSQSCQAGFLSWNKFWNGSYFKENVNNDLDPLAHVHVYHENWVSKLGHDFMDFQRHWETVMICLTSEAICKTVGSMMSQHSQNGSLKAENFNMEMMLQYNLGPMHLMESLISDIFASENKK